MIKSCCEAKNYEMINSGEYFARPGLLMESAYLLRVNQHVVLMVGHLPMVRANWANLESALEEVTNGCLIGISDDDTDLNSKMFMQIEYGRLELNKSPSQTSSLIRRILIFEMLLFRPLRF